MHRGVLRVELPAESPPALKSVVPSHVGHDLRCLLVAFCEHAKMTVHSLRVRSLCLIIGLVKGFFYLCRSLESRGYAPAVHGDPCHKPLCPCAKDCVLLKLLWIQAFLVEYA